MARIRSRKRQGRKKGEFLERDVAVNHAGLSPGSTLRPTFCEALKTVPHTGAALADVQLANAPVYPDPASSPGYRVYPYSETVYLYPSSSAVISVLSKVNFKPSLSALHVMVQFR